MNLSVDTIPRLGYLASEIPPVLEVFKMLGFRCKTLPWHMSIPKQRMVRWACSGE